MLTISSVKNAQQAASYYEQQDDYYSESGSAPTEWFGKGAKAMGFEGQVETEQFKNLMQGKLPKGQKMATGSGGKNHRPGWDLTFSAPKSVSIMALVAGDDRLLQAHAEAVKSTLTEIERVLIQTRIKKDGQITIEKTRNLIAATFRHETNRLQEPQLHTHAILMNITQRQDGLWRAIETKDIYQVQKKIGEFYRQELARQVVKLGYQIDKKSGKHSSLFEIAGVPQAAIDEFSRRSQEIEAALKDKGLDRDTATAKQKDAVSVGTRQKKSEIDHARLRANWRQLAASHRLENVLATSKSQQPTVSMHEKKLALDHAIEKLAERDSVFPEQRLIDEALRFGLGSVSRKDIQYQISIETKEGRLVARKIDGESAFTTQNAIEREMQMIKSLTNSIGASLPLMSSLESENLVHQKMKEANLNNFSWNVGQIRATKNLLESFDRIQVIQGYAGTAKTTTVLKTAAEVYAAAGYQVKAMAPTHAAAAVLGDAINSAGETVQKNLMKLAASTVDPKLKQVWMVDEASMLSSKQMAELVRQSERHQAKLILVGDAKQLASQEAGAAFRQVQQHLKTSVLDEIVRQKNRHAKTAVETSLSNDLKETLKMVDQVGGVIELQSRSDRIDAIANNYLTLTPDQRKKTLVIAPGRDDRNEINHKIREGLIERGEIGRDGITIETYYSKNLTQAESKDAASYEVGDTIKFAKDYEKNEIKKGDYFQIVGVDQQANLLKIKATNGNVIEINPRTQTKFEAYSVSQKEFSAGDKIVINQTGEHLKNGEEGIVKSVNDDKVTVTLNGREVDIDVSQQRNRHLDHAYAETAHKAQGKTVDLVLVHAESHRQNLMNQKSLYVSLSRARQSIRMFTDDREKLIEQVQERKAEKQNALELNN